MFFCFRMKLSIYLLLFISLLSSCTSLPKYGAETYTPGEKLNIPNTLNLVRVDQNLYRCAQPELLSFNVFDSLKIKTIVNLRYLKSDKEIHQLSSSKAKLIEIKVNSFRIEKWEADSFIKIMSDPNNYPVLVHCKHGSDRTGVMTALYRVKFMGWTKEQALQEMVYGDLGFHKVFRHMVRFVRKYPI